jgi:hypothetical protein
MNLLHAIRSAFALAHIGGCPRCMRTSCLLMVTSWAFVLIALASPVPAVEPLLLIPSAVLTLLWLVHVLVGAKRSTSARDSQGFSRRRALNRFATAAIGAVALSVGFSPKAYTKGSAG